MLIRPCSDFHIETLSLGLDKIIDTYLPELDTDKDTVLTFAGDLSQLHREDWIKFLDKVSERFKAIVSIVGNHEYYNNYYFSRIPKYINDKVHILQNDYIIIDDVAFIGGSLWTNFANDPLYKEIARSGMSDYVTIGVRDGDNGGRRLTPEDTVEEFYKTKDFIFKSISILKENYKTVVVTHHSPTPESIHERFTGQDLNYAFFTDLRDDIEHNGPTLWHWGHMHSYYKGRLGNTRLILNPLGYVKYGEKSSYDNKLVMEI